jgi:hypothetical protein
LGNNPNQWPKNTCVEIPENLKNSIYDFAKILLLILSQDFKEASSLFFELPERELNEFVRIHSYYAYKTRVNEISKAGIQNVFLNAFYKYLKRYFTKR